MKRWHWASLALLGGMVAVALIAVPHFGAGTQHAAAQASPSLVLDMDVTDGTGPCNPVTTSRGEQVGPATYKIAVCLVDSAAAPDGEPAAFNFEIDYDDTLNECVPDTDCATNPNTTDPLCRDSNPDANTGLTVFSSPSLGGGYDCTGSGTAPPSCDLSTATGPGNGRAFLSCVTTGTPTLAVGEGVSSPIAEVEFRAIGGGTDSMTLTNVGATNPALDGFLGCPGGPGTCAGGTDVKGGPTPTPRATATTASTAAPSSTPRCSLIAGIQGLPTCEPTPRAHTPTPTPGPTETATAGAPPPPPPPPPPSGGPGANVTPPNTGQGNSSLPWSGSVLWVISAIAAASLAGGGIYLRRARARR